MTAETLIYGLFIGKPLALVATVSFVAIMSVVILSAMNRIPASAAAPVPFVFGIVLVAALAGLGITNTTLTHSLDAATKLQKGITGKPVK